MTEDSGVTVGLAGELICRDASASAAVAKAGGTPYFFGIDPPCQASALTCTKCKEPLCLVAQVQLPPIAHGGVCTPQTLYIFCCTHESCASQTDSWRAFRHLAHKQEHQNITRQDMSSSTATPAPQTLSAVATEASMGPAAVVADAWGLSSDNWGVSAQEPAQADTAELNSALEQLIMQSALCSQEYLRQPRSARKREQREPGPEAQGCSIKGLPCLPEFELWLQSEPGRAGTGLDRADDIQKAISAYEQSFVSEGSQSGGSKQPEGSWANEQYEEDAAFSKYTKRLQRCPGQCLRLNSHGGILWPRRELPRVPRCPHCQAEKQCIAQLMAPLIAMLYEAADWVAELGEGYSQELPTDVPSSWEWLTVAVFACMAQCARSCPSAFVEETVIVVNETVTDGGWAY